MSETATVNVVKVNTRQVGKETKRTLWEVKDGNGKVYTTFVAGIGNAALQYEGGPAIVEFTEKQNGDFTNRYLESIKPAPAPAKGTPEYEEPEVDWDAKERRQYRSRAWAQAISAMQHTGSSNETPKRVFERVKPLAHAIYLDIVGDFANPPPAAQDTDLDPSLSSRDEDIPF